MKQQSAVIRGFLEDLARRKGFPPPDAERGQIWIVSAHPVKGPDTRHERSLRVVGLVELLGPKTSSTKALATFQKVISLPPRVRCQTRRVEDFDGSIIGHPFVAVAAHVWSLERSALESKLKIWFPEP